MKKKSGTKKKAASDKRIPRVGVLAKIAGAIASPVDTVSSVMQWLNQQFGLHLPTLPLAGWPAIMQSLWSLFIKGGIPSGPLPWYIPVEGTWPAIFPQIGPTPVRLENIVIYVKHKNPGSPF